MSTLLLRRRENSDRVAPVREMFAHVAEMRQLYAALIASDKLQAFLELGQEYFARAIAQRMAELSSRKIAPAHRAAIAHALAGSLLSLMSWWLDHGALASRRRNGQSLSSNGVVGHCGSLGIGGIVRSLIARRRHSTLLSLSSQIRR